MSPNDLRHKIVLRLLDAVLDRATGRKEDETIFYKPSERIFIGNLSPENESALEDRVKTRLSPNSIGLEFQLPRNVEFDAKIVLRPSGAFYYRVYPSYEQQLKFSGAQPLAGSPSAHPMTLTPGQSGVWLAPIFKKLKLQDVTLEIPLTKLLKEEDQGESIFDLTSHCMKLWKLAESDPRFFRKFIVMGKRRKRKVEWIPVGALTSEVEYEKYLRQASKEEMLPTWSLIISRRVFETKEGYRVILSLSNASEAERDYSKENVFFESRLNAKLVGGAFRPYVLEYLRQSYDHDRTIRAGGINCSCREVSDAEIETEHVPVFEEKRFEPVELADLTFALLANDPLRVLPQVEKMLEQRKQELATIYGGKAVGPEAQKVIHEDLNSIGNEIARFSNGLDVLRTHSDALRSFKLMNEAFRRASKYGTWRLFQIVFIVSLIPDVVSVVHTEVKNFREYADLLFYPTGGGKTEAFLGLAVFQAFFDRINGKKAGISSIAKFPLRLLSLQQLQRIADIFAKAELVRRSQPDLSSTDFDQFSVGYYVGKNNTPNELSEWDPNQQRYATSQLETWEKNPDQAKRFLIVSRCPFCNGAVKIKADPKKIRLYHWCQNPDCESGGPLPILISDAEIYRYLPTFVVSTLDKMVTCGFQRKFRNLMGGAFLKCPDHGYSSSWKCSEGVCKRQDLTLVTLRDPYPGLLIQDELHLVRETLGCFASHYETFFTQAIATLSGESNKQVKIVGATATASNYKEHIEQLYLKKAIKFPTKVDLYLRRGTKTARVIVGIKPNARTVINSMEDIIFAINSEHQHLARLSDNELSNVLSEKSIDRSVFTRFLEDFETVLAYHIKKIDAEQLNRSVWSRINRWLELDNLDTIKPVNLTGDVTFQRIRDVMHEIESRDTSTPVGLATATSVISHGIDIDKLNLMVFMGMPGNNAEYIQAQSRVARKEEGLVVVLFNPVRERDQSYYRYFLKFHELSDLLIEGVPVNRWAPSALERTSSGVFTASVYNLFGLRVMRNQKRDISKVASFKKALAEQWISEEEMKGFIRKSYGVDFLNPPQRDLTSRLLDNRVTSYVNSILNFDGNPNSMINQVIDPQPLLSLRNVESDVSVSLDAVARNIVSNYGINADLSEAQA